MKDDYLIIKYLAFIISMQILLAPFYSQSWANKSPYDWALIQLDYARDEKVTRLDKFSKKINGLARQASKDKNILAFFKMNQEVYNAVDQNSVPASLSADITEMREHFNRYYIENYFSFYDILFLNMDGIVFYTLRKESDMQSNFLHENSSNGPLGNCISKKPSAEVFVDFHEYGPSAEPAAFFVEPVYKNGVQTGWIALQWAINKFISIFASTDDLGQTGETFLVNNEGLMLTESYFKSSSTVLKEHLDDRNIQNKFRKKKGHRTVTDYRGATALSSFEVVEFVGTRWLVVAKIDKDEITSNHYALHKRYNAQRLLGYLKKMPTPPLQDIGPVVKQSSLRVDMDEFLKAENGEQVETWGVSTCTALLACFPGRFAYLAHISPKDVIYGGNDTNLLAQVTKKMKSFDIYSCEKREIIFVVVAPHLDSLATIIDRLLEDGFLLSQIRVLYNSAAKSASLLYDYTENQLIVSWKISQEKNPHGVHDINNAVNVGGIIEHIFSNE
jgi:hypothetical protein